MPQFNSKPRNDALSLLKKICSFETILVAMMFLQIFKITTPLSDYLQTQNLDFVQAYNQISCTYTTIAKCFANYFKSKIENHEDQIDIEIKEEFPIRQSECFDPRRFKGIRENGVPSNALKKICQLLPDIDRDKLKDELVTFATSWPLISKADLHIAYDNLDEVNIEDEWTVGQTISHKSVIQMRYVIDV
ncbi:zinc finger MYM-type protein 1-like [Aphis craccivora]|uniref:Zinc finger MYM-type protein 1-like n=1 Tax=Aphis craccivora TaxID=307492 RepID=A0A6G0ZAX2_APHCR|nr:zinc finger MYM-type protein 1-like [Aphis craccivora]